jgi:hypothetical protein
MALTLRSRSRQTETLSSARTAPPVVEAPKVPELDAYIAASKLIVNSLEHNVFIANLDLMLVFINRFGLQTLQKIEPDIRSAFGVTLSEVLGGSIHRFHRDPARIERILNDSSRFPHNASFSFGKVALSTRINLIMNEKGVKIGYIVAWDDSSSLQRSLDAVGSLSEQLRTAASTVTEFSASIEEISRSAVSAADMAEKTSANAELSITLVETLTKVGNEVAQITNTIATVADQTDLLALNATIEAARAGNAGKGFAVVAGEVKSLALDTSEATKQISGQIRAMHDAINKVRAASDSIAAGISQVSEFQQTIASAVEEQAVAVREMGMNINSAAAFAENVQREIVS